MLSGCNNEAFQLAQQHGQMETYADIIRDKGKSQDYYSIAVHFENENNWLKAGKFFLASDCYDRALRHFLQCHVNEEGENIRLAIECVGRARDDSLSRILLDYLLGHHEDGAAKHASFLFQFYVSLEQYTEAASTAVIIARDQQVKGEYKRARKFLFEMYKDSVSHFHSSPFEKKSLIQPNFKLCERISGNGKFVSLPKCQARSCSFTHISWSSRQFRCVPTTSPPPIFSVA